MSITVCSFCLSFILHHSSLYKEGTYQQSLVLQSLRIYIFFDILNSDKLVFTKPPLDYLNGRCEVQVRDDEEEEVVVEEHEVRDDIDDSVILQTWLIDSKTIAAKVKNATQPPSNQVKDCGANRQCPNCFHRIDNSDVAVEWPGLPAGVKFYPSDTELIKHLSGKVGLGNSEPPLMSNYLLSITGSITSMATYFNFFYFVIVSLSLVSFGRAQGRAPHGLAYANPMAFSPAAYDFFHPNSATPKGDSSPCIQSGCAPVSLSAVAKSSLAQENQVSTSHSNDGPVGTGVVAGVVFGFILSVLLGMGIYYVAVTRRANVSRAVSVQPAV
ncbi:hypothetical protein GIB67_027644 [Kingdonia uniflora]|uniref:Uncharacterized protein n=1 Tax=Kingdonia uniflora TaxID=39325 RepID=A0A7J7NL68_9MAGN|nr:hypothetical protein GIB67_027644 [Kingdonia uniflora]